VPFEVGDAGVDTAPGQGSTFWLTVRLKKGETGQGGHTAPGPSETEAILKRDHAGARILLAEDEPVNREITLSLLDDVGLAIDIAEDGAQALKLAETNEYALIPMDRRMAQHGRSRSHPENPPPAGAAERRHRGDDRQRLRRRQATLHRGRHGRFHFQADESRNPVRDHAAMAEETGIRQTRQHQSRTWVAFFFVLSGFFAKSCVKSI